MDYYFVTIRMPESSKELVKQAAKSKHLTMAAWSRQVLLTAAEEAVAQDQRKKAAASYDGKALP